MIAEEWKQVILKCSHDEKQLELLSKLLEEEDKCKKLLYDMIKQLLEKF